MKRLLITILCLMPFLGFAQIGLSTADTSLRATVGGQIQRWKSENYYNNSFVNINNKLASKQDIITVSNGLTKTGNNISLGGLLTTPLTELRSNINQAFAIRNYIPGGTLLEFKVNSFSGGAEEISFGRSNGSLREKISINVTGMVVDDTRNGWGLMYANNYSSTFVPRSLVDKGYVDDGFIQNRTNGGLGLGSGSGLALNGLTGTNITFQSSLTDAPTSNRGVVKTFNYASNTFTWQEYMWDGGNDSWWYRNRSSSAGWRNWYQVASRQWTSANNLTFGAANGSFIPLQLVDADTISKSNITYANNASLNLPTLAGSTGGFLTTHKGAAGERFQSYSHIGSDDSFWYRRYSVFLGAWEPWHQIASRDWVASLYAPVNNAALTGNPTAPTPPSADSTDKIATTKYVKNQEYVSQDYLLDALTIQGAQIAANQGNIANEILRAQGAELGLHNKIDSLAAIPAGTPDSTVFRTTDNSLSLAQIQTKFDQYQTIGTWTPTGVTLTSGLNKGYYVKTGKQVTAYFRLVFDNSASTTQNEIGGLPFTTGTGLVGDWPVVVTKQSTGTTPIGSPIQGIADYNDTIFRLWLPDASSPIELQDLSSYSIEGFVTYIID